MAKILTIMLMIATINLNNANAARATSANQAHYYEFLDTETAIIDTLRNYITNFEAKISIIKRKTLEIKDIHSAALNDVDKYVSNPLNALTILKRFATDWNVLQKMANNLLNSTDETAKNRNAVTAFLKFPSEDDFDETVENLLRLQDIYNLEPKRLSLGEMNGVKYGPQMSWSDCLEVGRKSDERGDYKIAKFWIETAMEKLSTAKLPSTEISINGTDTSSESNVLQSNEILKARFDILQALLNAEFHMGNFEKALEITNEMLLLKPQHKGVFKAKTTIENTLEKETKRARNKRLKRKQKIVKSNEEIKKSVEAMLIEEICSASTMAPSKMNLDASSHKCYLQNGNLYELQVQPNKLEILSIDPYIMILHDILTARQTEDLKQLIEETSIDYDEYDENEYKFQLEFSSKLAKQKLRHLNEKLQRHTGHSHNLFDKWLMHKRTFQRQSTLEDIYDTTETATAKQRGRGVTANILLNLQMAKLGGSIIFPQLELSLQVPNGSLLYWSNLNEFQEVDYRIKHHICPVIAGTQIGQSAVTAIRRGVLKHE